MLGLIISLVGPLLVIFCILYYHYANSQGMCKFTKGNGMFFTVLKK